MAFLDLLAETKATDALLKMKGAVSMRQSYRELLDDTLRYLRHERVTWDEARIQLERMCEICKLEGVIEKADVIEEEYKRIGEELKRELKADYKKGCDLAYQAGRLVGAIEGSREPGNA